MLTTQGLTAPSNPDRCKSVCTERLRTSPRHGTAAAGSLAESLHFSGTQCRASRNSRENSRPSAKTPDRQRVAMARPKPSGSRMDRQLERDVCELVRRVTGLQDEADPNFQLALDFAWSNFRCGIAAAS